MVSIHAIDEENIRMFCGIRKECDDCPARVLAISKYDASIHVYAIEEGKKAAGFFSYERREDKPEEARILGFRLFDGREKLEKEAISLIRKGLQRQGVRIIENLPEE